MSVSLKKKSAALTVEGTVTIVLPDSYGDVMDKLHAVKEARKTMDKLEKELKAAILDILPDRTDQKTLLEVGGVVRAALTQGTRKGTDSKRLQDEFPDAYAQTLKETNVETFTMV